MIRLINHTKATSQKGRLVILDSNDYSAFIYASFNPTKVAGVTAEEAPYRKPCDIATIGDRARVSVVGNVQKGDILRASKSTDRAPFGTCVVAKATDSPYLRVGEALESGKGLVLVILELTYQGTDTSGYVPYEGATGDVDLGENALSIGTATDYLNIDATGYLTLEGTATTWDDIRIIPSIFDVAGGTDPDVNSYQPGGSGTTFLVYAFAKGDSGYFTIQLPHDYKAGSTLKAHVHWTPGARGVAESGNTVQWRLDYSFASIDSNFPASSTIPLPDVCDGTNHKHQMTPEVDIAGTGLSASSQMIGRVYRWNDASDTWVGTLANLPIFIELDLHYMRGSLGTKDST